MHQSGNGGGESKQIETTAQINDRARDTNVEKRLIINNDAGVQVSRLLDDLVLPRAAQVNSTIFPLFGKE